MIPAIDPATGNLPPGVHEANWEEIEARYGTTMRRRELLRGLRAALDNLTAAGCRQVYLDGSFVGAKRNPPDYDACWVAQGVDETRLDPLFLDFSQGRAAQKLRYGGEWFIAGTLATRSGRRYPEFFQRDKHTGAPKGILVLQLGDAR
jgi:hypothetical protein